MFKKYAPIILIVVSVTLVCASFFGSSADAVDGWKLDPLKTQEIIKAHDHDIVELIDAVEKLESEVAKLKKGKK